MMRLPFRKFIWNGRWVTALLPRGSSSRRVRVEYICDTHGHVDHVAANAAIQRATGGRLLIHEADRELIERPHPFWSAMVGGIEPSSPAGTLAEGDELPVGDLTVRVPADNAEFVGVRDVVGQDGLDRVFEVLRAPYAEEPTNWSRRYNANLEKPASGDVIKVAEVVRDLWRRERERGLSAGEKRMLAKARQILVSELALAENTNEDKAEALLDEVLAS